MNRKQEQRTKKYKSSLRTCSNVISKEKPTMKKCQRSIVRGSTKRRVVKRAESTCVTANRSRSLSLSTKRRRTVAAKVGVAPHTALDVAWNVETVDAEDAILTTPAPSHPTAEQSATPVSDDGNTHVKHNFAPEPSGSSLAYGPNNTATIPRWFIQEKRKQELATQLFSAVQKFTGFRQCPSYAEEDERALQERIRHRRQTRRFQDDWEEWQYLKLLVKEYEFLMRQIERCTIYNISHYTRNTHSDDDGDALGGISALRIMNDKVRYMAQLETVKEKLNVYLGSNVSDTHNFRIICMKDIICFTYKNSPPLCEWEQVEEWMAKNAKSKLRPLDYVDDIQSSDDLDNVTNAASLKVQCLKTKLDFTSFIQCTQIRESL